MLNNNRIILVGICGVVLFVSSCNHGQVKNISITDKEDSILKASGFYIDTFRIDTFLKRYPFVKDQKANLFKSYNDEGDKYFWFNMRGIMIPQGELFISEINSAQNGLEDTLPAITALNTLYRSYLIDTTGKHKWRNLELMLSSVYFKYARIIWGGMNENEDINYFIRRKRMPYKAFMDSVDGDSKFLAGYKVSYKQYSLLAQYVRKYRGIEKRNLWKPVVSYTKRFVKGDSNSIVKIIRIKLFLLGDLPNVDTTGMIFDDNLVKAVKKFQYRNGLKENGRIDTAEMRLLNKPMQQYIEQILANMERSRWVNFDFKGDHIFVNIPEFKLYAYQNDSVMWTCSIIAGAEGTKTIMFSGSLRYVVFAPYWNLPLSIVKKVMLPYWQNNPDSIKKNTEMEVVDMKGNIIDATKVDWKKYNANNFPYIMRQKPGKENPLGKVKFLFPNNFSIYLHDTPWKNVFDESKRSFSHGCIRVGDALQLTKWLLRSDPSWTDEKINEAMNLTKEKYYTLKKGVPVSITYFTTWVDNNGDINFRDDLYGHDERLLKTFITD